jgi:hypothetical protein
MDARAYSALFEPHQGSTKDAATFGKASDTWRNELADPKSVAGQLSARFLKCGTNISRSGYDVHD